MFRQSRRRPGCVGPQQQGWSRCKGAPLPGLLPEASLPVACLFLGFSPAMSRASGSFCLQCPPPSGTLGLFSAQFLTPPMARSPFPTIITASGMRGSRSPSMGSCSVSGTVWPCPLGPVGSVAPLSLGLLSAGLCLLPAGRRWQRDPPDQVLPERGEDPPCGPAQGEARRRRWAGSCGWSPSASGTWPDSLHVLPRSVGVHFM